MKIKYLKTYQSIEFGKEKRQLNSFTASEYMPKDNYSNQPRVEFEQHPNGILIYTDTECILVGWPNIAFLRYDRAAFKPAKPAKAG